MRRVVIHFPIVIYKSEDDGMRQFTAHCLTLDILADADSVEGAVSELLELIEVHLDAAERHGADPFRRAPDEYWSKLGHARALAPELVERILRKTNARNAKIGSQPPPIESSQIDIRELQTA